MVCKGKSSKNHEQCNVLGNPPYESKLSGNRIGPMAPMGRRSQPVPAAAVFSSDSTPGAWRRSHCCGNPLICSCSLVIYGDIWAKLEGIRNLLLEIWANFWHPIYSDLSDLSYHVVSLFPVKGCLRVFQPHQATQQDPGARRFPSGEFTWNLEINMSL